MEQQLGFLVSHIKHLGGRIFDKILSQKNIEAFNGAQGRILYVLWNGDGISLQGLSDKTGLAPTTLTSMVDRMENSGLIQRKADKVDRRKILLYLTKEARQLKPDYEEVSEEVSKIHYSGFSDEEIIQVEGYLKRILINLENYGNGN